MLLPISKLLDKAELAKDESDVSYFMSLLYLGEQLIKLVGAGLVSTIENDKERHRYSQLHRLVRADGIGEWASVIDEVITGPTSQFLPVEARNAQQELTQRVSQGTWQYESLRLLNDCVQQFETDQTELAAKIAGKNWFSYFAALRNKSRGHGILHQEVCNVMGPKLQRSIELFASNFSLFKQPWVYLYRNLSGKYRVTYLNARTEEFTYLKSSKTENLNNGVYLYLNRPVEVELVYSDPDATDFLFPNGGFNGKRYECLSYITGNKEFHDAAPYVIPASELPASETQGLGKLELIGNCFANLPPVQKAYVRRVDLEGQLTDILVDDRHPVVTLVGRGGIGKTSLAISVLHQLCQMSRYEAIIWFSARDIDLLMQGAKPVKPHVLSEENISEEFVNLVEPAARKEKGFKARSFFESELTKSTFGPFLIILDNFETIKNPVELFQWLDTFIRLPNKILITTRFREFKADYPIEVAGMNESEFRQLVASTVLELGIPEELITENYLEELYSESDGHPYVVKILLGEVAKAMRVEKIRRIVASKDDILTALFERTYAGLSPAAKRIFLTLSNWRSNIPQLAIEAVLMREENELMNVEDALEELSRSSFVQVIGSGSYENLFISVPLAASIFGKKKLSVSPMKTAIQADTNLLQEFGVGQNNNSATGIGYRVDTFFKNTAKKINAGKEALDKYIPLLEFICRKYPPAWFTLVSLYIEEEKYSLAKEALRSYLELTEQDDERAEAWRYLARLCNLTQDWEGEAHALVELAETPNVPFSTVSNAVNQMIGLLQQRELPLDTDEREILIRRIIDTVNRRLDQSHGDNDDYSILAWLYLYLNDRKSARDIVKKILSRDPEHYHSQRLAKKLGL